MKKESIFLNAFKFPPKNLSINKIEAKKKNSENGTIKNRKHKSPIYHNITSTYMFFVDNYALETVRNMNYLL